MRRTMNRTGRLEMLRRIVLVLLAAAALALPACTKPASYVAEDAKRKEVIEALISNTSYRQEVIDRLVGPPIDRVAVIDRILKDEGAAGDLVGRILHDDRGRALVASKVAADTGAKTFIRMLMLTGVMGDSMTQKQADALGLGEPFAFGNERRTMFDLKEIGRRIEQVARQKEGHYPVCADFGDLKTCLEKKLPAGTLDSVRLIDSWGHPFQYHTDAEGRQYVLVSYATDGQYDGLGKVGPTQSFDCDIVFSNGDFVQWPGWIRKNDIK